MAQKSYHFDLGDSTFGPVGFCASVTADSPEHAVAMLKEKLGNQFGGQYDLDEAEDGELGIDYVSVYFNFANITIHDIDEV